jgi:DeoR/GlpR family transcriptional regulator of sugar metabolism
VFAPERRQRILELLRVDGAASLRQIAEHVDTSEVTVRRDLKVLEAQGLLARRHGGAVLPAGEAAESTYAEKAHVAAAEKAAIARHARDLVDDGDAIAVGSGTTCQALARRLSHARDLTVVTNSVLVATALVKATGVEVLLSGGSLRGPSAALVGSAAERGLAGLRTRRVFLSGDGFTAERGLSTYNLAVAGVDRALAATGGEVVVLADHTKVGVDSTCLAVPTAGVQRLLTDAAADRAEVRRLRDAGVDVTVV